MDAWSWSPWGFLKVGDPQSSRCCWFKRVCTVYLIARRTARWTARLRFQAFHVASTFWVALGNMFFFIITFFMFILLSIWVCSQNFPVGIHSPCGPQGPPLSMGNRLRKFFPSHWRLAKHEPPHYDSTCLVGNTRIVSNDWCSTSTKVDTWPK